MARIHPGTPGSRFAPPAGHGGTAHQVARQRTANGGIWPTGYQQTPAGTIAQVAS